jgi:hypothetical protein
MSGGRSMFSRRRVITILGAVAGLPPVLSRDKPRSETPLHRWQGTASVLPPIFCSTTPTAGLRSER